MNLHNVVIAFLLVVLCVNVNAMGKRNKQSSDEARFYAKRIEEIKRQAPQMGIPVDEALKVKARVRFCPEQGRNKDGSWVCGDCPETGEACVHGWFRGYKGAKHVEYLFAVPDLKDGTIAHEVHHELLIVWYGITGHPKRSTVTRIDTGQKLTLKHAEIIGWRWPKLVNWALPQAIEIESNWDADIQCGTE